MSQGDGLFSGFSPRPQEYNPHSELDQSTFVRVTILAARSFATLVRNRVKSQTAQAFFWFSPAPIDDIDSGKSKGSPLYNFSTHSSSWIRMTALGLAPPRLALVEASWRCCSVRLPPDWMILAVSLIAGAASSRAGWSAGASKVRWAIVFDPSAHFARVVPLPVQALWVWRT
jgi:hypothetical protein